MATSPTDSFQLSTSPRGKPTSVSRLTLSSSHQGPDLKDPPATDPSTAPLAGHPHPQPRLLLPRDRLQSSSCLKKYQLSGDLNTLKKDKILKETLNNTLGENKTLNKTPNETMNETLDQNETLNEIKSPEAFALN